MTIKKKNHQSWSWIFILSFFILGIYDIRFGLLGFICMGAPLYHAFRGRGKVHCSKYCPRGSFLGRFLPYISFNHTLPTFMRTKKFKHLLLILMLTVFGIGLSHTQFDLEKVAYTLFRLMGVSFILGIVLGILFKPRSWCQICPMGHGTSLITQHYKNTHTHKKAS